MRHWICLMLVACLVLSAAPASAQYNHSCSDPDLLGLFFDNGEYNYTASGAFAQFTLTAVILNASAPSAEAFEFRLAEPANVFLVNTTWPGDGLNVSTHPEYICGLLNPVPAVGGDITLLRFTYIATDMEQRDWAIEMTNYQSIPGHLAYQDGSTGDLVPMDPIGGVYGAPVARLNPVVPLELCENQVNYDMAVAIAGQGEDLVAATRFDATDGFDSAFDVEDSNPALAFPRAGWVSADARDFRTDVRTTYDPTQEMKTWTFVARTSVTQTAGVQAVRLDFAPDLPVGTALLLRDLDTGATIDLFASGLTYDYTVGYGFHERYFDLIIGSTPAPSGLVIDIAANAGSLGDPLTRAATADSARDGFDPGLDKPEPAPPPGNYVAASFNHPEWPLGPRFASDVRAIFDPTTETRVWPLMVETDQSGDVTLSFSPSFGPGDGYGFQLRDLYTGQIFDLFPALSYVYPNPGVPTTRHFELIVGRQSAPELNPTSRTVPSGWSLIGLPLEPDPGAASMHDVVLGQSPGYAYAFTYEGTAGYQTAEPGTTAEVGRGYWLGTTAGFEWTMSGERSLDGVSVTLRDGWNLVGNANWFPGPFEGLRVIRQGQTYDWLTATQMGFVSADVQSYDHTTDTYFDAVDLQPWQAYWINSLEDGIVLRFDWENFQVLPKRLTAQKSMLSRDEWNWQTDLVLTDAARIKRSITLGAHESATDGFDAVFDKPQPPQSPEGGPLLAFQRPEWDLAAGDLFTRDLVGQSEEPVAWRVVLSSPNAGPATLSWDSSLWPEGVDYQLYFPHENRVVVMSMRHENSLRLDLGAEPLTVVVRTPDMTSGVGDLPGLAYRLGAHPNPFNPRATVFFEMPQRGRAEVRIYSVRGELIDRLGGDVYDAGRHELVWQGRDRQGRNVPSGSYFARLYVDGEVRGAVTKMSLVR